MDVNLKFKSIRFSYSPHKGFSLVELLVVIAIAGVLAALAVPMISSIMMSGNVNETTSGVSLTLEEARAYAMSHNTYVWVGFYQNTAANALTVGAIAGSSGQSTDLTSTTTYAPIVKLRTYPNFILSSTINLTGMTGNPGNNTAVDVNSSTGAFQQMEGGTAVPFSAAVQFNPEGEASFPSQKNTVRWIQIGLQPVQGNNKSSPNNAVIQLATLTGQVSVFRR